MHLPFEAFAAILVLHPLASASCTGMVTIVIAATPISASAVTMAVTTNVVLLFISNP